METRETGEIAPKSRIRILVREGQGERTGETPAPGAAPHPLLQGTALIPIDAYAPATESDPGGQCAEVNGLAQRATGFYNAVAQGIDGKGRNYSPLAEIRARYQAEGLLPTVPVAQTDDVLALSDPLAGAHAHAYGSEPGLVVASTSTSPSVHDSVRALGDVDVAPVLLPDVLVALLNLDVPVPESSASANTVYGCCCHAPRSEAVVVDAVSSTNSGTGRGRGRQMGASFDPSAVVPPSGAYTGGSKARATPRQHEEALERLYAEEAAHARTPPPVVLALIDDTPVALVRGGSA